LHNLCPQTIRWMFTKQVVPDMGLSVRLSRALEAQQLCTAHHEIWGYKFHQTATAPQLRRLDRPPMMQENIGGRELL
jgi:hypothetical protein